MANISPHPWVSNTPEWVCIRQNELQSANELVYRDFNAGKYTDLTITCKGATYKAHRIIICPQSKVFSAMVNGEFKEAQEARIDLPDDESTLIKRLLDFLYTEDYSTSSEDPPGNINEKISCSIHAEMYILGDKYDIPGLMSMAADRFFSKAMGYTTCDDEDSEAGRDRDKVFAGFLEAIPVVYRVPARADGKDLRRIATSYMCCYGPDMELAAHKDDRMEQLLNEAMDTVPEFARDVALQFLKRPTVACDKCATKDPADCKFALGQIYCSVCKTNPVYCRVNDKRIPKKD